MKKFLFLALALISIICNIQSTFAMKLSRLTSRLALCASIKRFAPTAYAPIQSERAFYNKSNIQTINYIPNEHITTQWVHDFSETEAKRVLTLKYVTMSPILDGIHDEPNDEEIEEAVKIFDKNNKCVKQFLNNEILDWIKGLVDNDINIYPSLSSAICDRAKLCFESKNKPLKARLKELAVFSLRELPIPFQFHYIRLIMNLFDLKNQLTNYTQLEWHTNYKTTETSKTITTTLKFISPKVNNESCDDDDDDDDFYFFTFGPMGLMLK